MLRALSIGHADRGRAVALFRDQQQRHRQREALFRKMVDELEQDHARMLEEPTSPMFGRDLTLQRGI